MRTTVDLDNDLLAETVRLTGTSEPSVLLRKALTALRKALTALIQREASRQPASLGGSDQSIEPPPRRRPA